MIGRYNRRGGSSDDRLEELTKDLKKHEERLKYNSGMYSEEELKRDIERTKEAIVAVLKNKYK